MKSMLERLRIAIDEHSSFSLLIVSVSVSVLDVSSVPTATANSSSSRRREMGGASMIRASRKSNVS